ncbi:MAG TPA: polyprenol monophosphomannose synthase [Candidatus Omnitrophica bacterium]|nr:polyprenol monophosphomannose synthase [Candidatus Omnitrophota bacterium]
MDHKILIIIPTYNEKENISSLIRSIFEVLPKADILIIDDSSPDGTGDIVRRIGKQNPQIKLITRSNKLGLGTAYIVGFKYARECNYDLIVQMDADFSHHPKYLPKFIEEVLKYPLVLGSRYIEGGATVGWGFSRKLLSYCGNLYARCILGISTRDLTGGYKCYQKNLVEEILLMSASSEGYVFQIEATFIAHKKGFAVKEIPIVFTDRRKGKSKISKKIVFEAIYKIPMMLSRFK